MPLPLNVRILGNTDYQSSFQAMKDFVADRKEATIDEFWYVEHPPVFTQGMAGKPEHILNIHNNIPVIQSDRGGQVTYHGPGQIVVYLLINLQRRKSGVRRFVEMLENAVIDLLKEFDIMAAGNRKAPGVYVHGSKIAAIGLRVRKNSTYHGLSLNVDMDLSPFAQINPCGYQGLEVTSMKKLGVSEPIDIVQSRLHYHLCHTLGYQFTPLEPCHLI